MNQEPNQFVSRGGIKLQHALSNFKLKISNYAVLDVGSSTGGFVDCLLQNGAAKVYSVDTAYGELAWKLRNDPKVIVMERTNILHLQSLPSPGRQAKLPKVTVIASESPQLNASQSYLTRDNLKPEQDNSLLNKIPTSPGSVNSNGAPQDDSQESHNYTKVDLITIDASWTKLEKILPVVEKFLKTGGQIIALLKPHYQAEKSKLIKGVLEESEALRVKGEVEKKIQNLGFKIEDSIDSPILGGGGNREYLLLIQRG